MKPKKATKTNTIERVAPQIAVYIALILLWQLLAFIGAELKWWKAYAFPTPIGVIESLFSLIKSGTLSSAIFFSLRRAVIGYAMSVAFGMSFGLILARSEIVRMSARPLLLGFQTLPSICWVPFAILWFGLSENAIIFVIIIGSAFSVAIAVDGAFRNVSPLIVKTAQTMGAKGFDLWFRVIFLAALPALVGGLKQGWSFAWRALMSAEVMSVSVGLGQTLILGRDFADIDRVALVMIMIIVIGVMIDQFIFAAAERHIMKKVGL